jgi:hypothetical protein
VLAEAAHRPATTRVLITGYPSAKLMEAAHAQHVTRVVIKPYPFEDLRAALRDEPAANTHPPPEDLRERAVDRAAAGAKGSAGAVRLSGGEAQPR